MPKMNDWQIGLAKKAKKGNGKALEKLLLAEVEYIYKMAYKILKDHADVEDCIQDATMKAYLTI